MKFKILKKEFLDGLAATLGIVEKKNVMPILANVLIEAERENPLIRIIATDLEVAVHIFVQAEIEEPGRVTVCAKSLNDIVREADSDMLSLVTTETDRVQITTNHGEFKIHGLAAKEFPNLPKVEGKFVRLAGDALRNTLNKVGFAMSMDETRYHLNGLLFERQEKGLVVVATDGHRLSYDRCALDLSVMKHEKVIVPRKGVAEILRLLSAEKSVELSVSDRHLFVRTERQTLYIRLIDGNFPDYHRVIPKDNPTVVNVPREALAGALRRVSLLANDRSKGVTFYFCNACLSLTSSSVEIGEGKEEIDIDYKGPVLNIGFNAKYVLDVLSAIPDEVVSVAFKDDLSPCLITCASDPGFKAVVMPMRM